MDARDLLLAYVGAHNVGVGTGDWTELAAMLDPACEMRFISPGAGPIQGREAVLRAFRDDPPGAELDVAEVAGEPAAAKAPLALVGAATRYAGTLHVGSARGGIAGIDVQ